jgi:hypothetical protein
MGKWIEKLKNLFTMTPAQLKHVESELKSVFGIGDKFTKCPYASNGGGCHDCPVNFKYCN